MIVLFPFKSSSSIRRCNQFGAEVYSLPGKMKYLLTDTSLMIRLAVSRRPDVIHAFTGASTILGFVSLLLGRILKIPSVMSIFGREDVTYSSKMSTILFLLSAELSTTIATNSEATRNLLPPKFHSKCKILLGGANLTERTEVKESEDSKVILFVGRLAKRKGVDDLLDSFAILERRVPSAHLVIVGDGPEREALRKKAKALGLRNVEFKGALFGEALNYEYARSAVCVLLSKSVGGDPATEGLGLTLIEASMHAKPLVGTRHGGIPEIIKDGVNGFLVPEGDWRSSSEALTKLLLDTGLASKMGQNAFQMARERFSWNAATDRLLESYRN